MRYISGVVLKSSLWHLNCIYCVDLAERLYFRHLLTTAAFHAPWRVLDGQNNHEWALFKKQVSNSDRKATILTNLHKLEASWLFVHTCMYIAGHRTIYM